MPIMKAVIDLDAALEHEGFGALAIGNPTYRKRREMVVEAFVSGWQAGPISIMNELVVHILTVSRSRVIKTPTKNILIRIERLYEEDADKPKEKKTTPTGA